MTSNLVLEIRHSAISNVQHIRPLRGGSAFDNGRGQPPGRTAGRQRRGSRATRRRCTPAVTNASDLKALVDTAANALKLAEYLQVRQGTKNTRKEVAQEMGRILDLVDARRRKDVDELLQKVAELDPRRSSKAEDPPAPNVEATDVRRRKRIKKIGMVGKARGKKKPMVAPPQPAGQRYCGSPS